MMGTVPLSFVHRFVPATVPGRIPLLLLHGTGGDETDLLPLGASLSPGAALLSPRGKVLEHGMPRFFSRLAEGVFDQDEVRRRSLDLAAFIVEARDVYHLRSLIAVGYSNGANVAAAAMVLRPGILAGAVLLRPMQVLEDSAATRAQAEVLMVSGASDPIVPENTALILAERLQASGATVDHRVLRAGHQLTQEDRAQARSWLAGIET